MEKFLVAFHAKDIFKVEPLVAVEIGFLAWALLALSMAAIFVVVIAVNRILKKKGKKN